MRYLEPPQPQTGSFTKRHEMATKTARQPGKTKKAAAKPLRTTSVRKAAGKQAIPIVNTAPPPAAAIASTLADQMQQDIRQSLPVMEVPTEPRTAAQEAAAWQAT
jgi:hypothetical protein